MGRKITADNFAEKIDAMLEKYCKDVADGASIAVQKASRMGATAINNAAAASFDSPSEKRGDKPYKKSWTRQYKKKRLKTEAFIYSKKPELPHLLEYGHAKTNGGRVPGRIHIAPIEKQITEMFEGDIREQIKKAGE